MTSSNKSGTTEIGYLAVSEVAGLGYCGGLLVVTATGRPVEFHCTTPVAANRAQEILYGATLKEFLVCDQIGIALLKKLGRLPHVVLVEERELCKLAAQVNASFGLFVHESNGDTEGSDISQMDERAGGQAIEVNEVRFEIYGNEPTSIQETLSSFSQHLPLNEPFDRIREAINEAHREAA